MSSSASESDENEDMSKLLSAVDTNFISDKMFKEKPASSQGENVNKDSSNNKPKSQRYLDNIDPIFQSELNVSESMQKHFCKKLSTAIEKQVDFIENNSITKELPPDNFPKLKSIRLTTDSDILKPKPLEIVEVNPNIGRKGIEIKRRKIKEDNGIVPVTEEDKIKECNIRSDEFSKETKSWRVKKNQKLLHYRAKKGVNYLVEPETEFTKLRKKNNWDEGKISTTNCNKHGLV